MPRGILVFALAFAACTACTSPPGRPTEVTVAASDTVRHLTDVESYRIRAVEGEDVSIALLDAEERTLATLRPGRDADGHVFLSLRDDAGGSARYSIEGSREGTSLILSARIESQGQPLVMETRISERGTVESVTLSAGTAQAPLDVVNQNGTAMDPALVETWLDGAGISELLESQAARTLFLVVSDPAIVEGAKQVVPSSDGPPPPADGVGVHVAASHKSNTCQQLWDFVAAMAVVGGTTCPACAAALAASPGTVGFSAILGLIACIACAEAGYLAAQMVAICYWDEFNKMTPEKCRSEATCPPWQDPVPSADEHSCVCECDPADCEARCRELCPASYVSSSCNNEERCLCVVQPDPEQPPRVCDAEGECADVCNPTPSSCDRDGTCDPNESCETCPDDCGGPCPPGGCCNDRECGIDPDCGVDCGDCASGSNCVNGLCECIPCYGRTCGFDTDCGGAYCGECPPNFECDQPLGVCTSITVGVCRRDPYCSTTTCPAPQSCECGVEGPPWCFCCRVEEVGGSSSGCDRSCGPGDCGWLPDGCGEFLDCGDCATCGSGACCSDGVCNGGETCDSCPIDCACAPPEDCPDGTCGAGETCTSCPSDCPCPAGTSCSGGVCVADGPCGDGVCEPGVEDCGNCPSDCPCWMPGTICVGGMCVTYCGNGTCDSDEYCDTCWEDCGSCCGNGLCDWFEDGCTCAIDCGPCVP